MSVSSVISIIGDTVPVHVGTGSRSLTPVCPIHVEELSVSAAVWIFLCCCFSCLFVYLLRLLMCLAV